MYCCYSALANYRIVHPVILSENKITKSHMLYTNILNTLNCTSIGFGISYATTAVNNHDSGDDDYEKLKVLFNLLF